MSHGSVREMTGVALEREDGVLRSDKGSAGWGRAEMSLPVSALLIQYSSHLGYSFPVDY